MECKQFLEATDVQEMLGVSLLYSYNLIYKTNAGQVTDSRQQGTYNDKRVINSLPIMKQIYCISKKSICPLIKAASLFLSKSRLLESKSNVFIQIVLTELGKCSLVAYNLFCLSGLE